MDKNQIISIEKANDQTTIHAYYNGIGQSIITQTYYSF